MGRKRTKNWYWFPETDQAVHEYNNTESLDQKNEIYENQLQYPLFRLAEYLLNVIPTNLIKMTKPEKMSWIIGELVEALPKIDSDQNPFAYLQITGRNAIWQANMRIKKSGEYKHLSIDKQYDDQYDIQIPVPPEVEDREFPEQYKLYVRQLRNYWNEFDKGNIRSKLVKEVIELTIDTMENVHNYPDFELNKNLNEFSADQFSSTRTSYLTTMKMMRPLFKTAYDNFLETENIHEPRLWSWDKYKRFYE